MGRQVNANLDDLALAGCMVRIEFEVETEDGDRTVYRNAVVTFPNGREMGSYGDTSLCFDCRDRNSNNFWALGQIIDLGVPFTWA